MNTRLTGAKKRQNFPLRDSAAGHERMDGHYATAMLSVPELRQLVATMVD